MDIKSISGVTCYVNDLDKTEKFYGDLGFRIGKREGNYLTVYVNWFWITFVEQDKEEKAEFQEEAHAEHKGAGLYLNMKVEKVDEFYNEIVAKNFTPSSEPRDWPWGNREFVLRDPDGYKLVFFEKL